MNRRRRILLGGGGSAPFTPASISGLMSWYDASDTATITDAGAGAVSQWNDKSGNGFHVSQGTALFRPTTGTRTVNSLNVIDFDGTNDSLIRTFADTTSYLANKDAATQFCVMLFEAGNYLTAYTTASGSAPLVGLKAEGGTIGKMRSADGSFYTSTGSIVASNVGIVALRAQRNAVPTLYNNGSAKTISGTCTDFPFTPVTNQEICLGSLNQGFGYFNGCIAEHITYDSYLSNANTNLVANYLKDKWAATWVDI